MSSVNHLVFDGFFPKVQIITYTQRITTLNLNAIQSTIYKTSCPQIFWVAIFPKMSTVGHLVFNGFFAKANQSITNGQRTTTANLNAIQPKFIRYRAHKLFERLFFPKCPPSANFFLIGFFAKVNHRNAQKIITSNLNAIQPRVHKTWRSQAF